VRRHHSFARAEAISDDFWGAGQSVWIGSVSAYAGSTGPSSFSYSAVTPLYTAVATWIPQFSPAQLAHLATFPSTHRVDYHIDVANVDVNTVGVPALPPPFYTGFFGATDAVASIETNNTFGGGLLLRFQDPVQTIVNTNSACSPGSTASTTVAHVLSGDWRIFMCLPVADVASTVSFDSIQLCIFCDPTNA
jgi:hypothetical protein